LSLIGSSHAMAWEGQAIDDIVGKSGDEGQYYIYNVGKKKFLTQSGIWGTSTGVDDSGLLMNAISKKSSGVYQFQSTLNSGYLILASSGDVNPDDKGHMFFDQKSTFSGTSWTVTKVSETENIYTIQCQNPGELYKNYYYITANKDDDSVEPTASADDDYSKWMFVSLKTLKEEFDNATGADVNNPVPASFFIYDAGFYINNDNSTKWTVGSSALSKAAVSNSYNSNGTAITIPSKSDNLLPTDAYNSSNALGSTYVYHIGNGYVHVKLGTQTDDDPGGTVLKEDQSLLSNSADYDSKYWHRPFGRYWTANIHGKSGKISQTISITRKGWYKVTCYGMSTDGKGYLFASGDNTTTIGDKYSTSNFVIPEETPDTYVKASYMLITNPTKYEQSVTVFVNENGTLTFGAEVTDGGETAWTCFDSFSLVYCGEGDLDLIIDETQTSVDYINAQTSDNYNQTLRLARTLNTNQWNSFVLPVNLNAGQVKTAFGGDTKLAQLDGAEGNRIYFKLVSLDDNEATAIAAGQLYIINPQIAISSGDEVKHRDEKYSNSVKTSQYYTINQVTFKSTDALKKATVEKNFQLGASTDGQMRMAGTYVSLTKTDNVNPIPAGSYVLSGGHWYYAVNGVNKVSGLRGWIETKAETGSKNLIFNIDGVDEEEVSTGIDGIYVDGVQTNTSAPKSGIYSISGQKMSGTASLPKGLYIVNGRKMIVK
ncbi:MAG: hypothetical protein ACI3Y5_09315, partial [Prevotella sp.]